MDKKSQNVILIGPRAAGKSKTSRHLSKDLGFGILSTDVLCSYESNGLTIPEIVARDGWPGFRRLEEDILAKTCRMSGLIIDTGGGILCRLSEAGNEVFNEQNSRLLKESGFVVHLTAGLEWLYSKVSQDPNRPQWNPQTDPRQEFVDMLDRRDPWYRKTADITVDTTGKKGKDIAALVMEHLQRAGFRLKPKIPRTM